MKSFPVILYYSSPSLLDILIEIYDGTSEENNEASASVREYHERIPPSTISRTPDKHPIEILNEKTRKYLLAKPHEDL